MQLAVEINALWLECLKRARLELAHCPTDEDVAELIESSFRRQ